MKSYLYRLGKSYLEKGSHFTIRCLTLKGNAMRQKLHFDNGKGCRLCGILSGPDSRQNPAIILCHGFTSSKESATYVKLENRLNRQGIATFRFDFWGHGESEGKFQEITISEAVNEVLNAIDFLKQQGYTRIGLMGSSFGGMAALISASYSGDVYVLALKCPVSNYLGKTISDLSTGHLKSWKSRGYTYYVSGDGTKHRLNYSFYEDAQKVDGYKSAEKIKVPTIIVHGDQDKTVPIGQSKQAACLINHCKLEVIPGADHGFTHPEHFDQMITLISEFIVKHS